MIDIEKIAASGDLPPAFAELLRKRPVVYSPAIPADDALAEKFLATRMALFVEHHRAQETMTTCSVTTALNIINAMRSSRGLGNCSTDDVLAGNKDGSWCASVANLQCKGVSLGSFKTLLEEATRELIPYPVKVVAYAMQSNTRADLELVQTLLRQIETDPRSFVAVNFNQASFLEDGFDVGHMSVIGGYDIAHDHALIFDVDIRDLRPYWIPLDILLRGMNTYDADGENYRGLITLETT